MKTPVPYHCENCGSYLLYEDDGDVGCLTCGWRWSARNAAQEDEGNGPVIVKGRCHDDRAVRLPINRAITKENIRRARFGLPPLDAAAQSG